MRVAHRIMLSTGLLLATLVAVLIYDVVQLRELAALQTGLTQIDMSASTRALELSRLLDELESTTKKLLVSRDSDYGERLAALRSAVDDELAGLAALALKPEQRRLVDALRDDWEQMPLAALTTLALEGELDRPTENDLAQVIDDVGGDLRHRAEQVAIATQKAMQAEASAAVEAGQRAATVSKLTMVAAVTISLPLLLFTLAAIRDPLRRLRAGTRSVTEGAFDIELETAGDDEFSGVAESFNEMVRRLGELDRLKREFLSHVSHELKGPLAAMQETNRALLDEVPGALNDRQKRLLELNRQSNARLSAMIGKLLDLARLEEGAVDYRLQACSVDELVREVAESFQAAARERGVQLEVSSIAQPLVAQCDRDRIIQVVANLLENAIKFASSGSTVRLAAHVGPDPAGDERLVVEVRDRGPGIPDDHKQRIFARFHQIAQPGTSSGGVGLGLAICREIVNAHHGALWVEDNPGGGSVFAFALPTAGGGAKRVAS